jgi:hypothetical protein
MLMSLIIGCLLFRVILVSLLCFPNDGHDPPTELVHEAEMTAISQKNRLEILHYALQSSSFENTEQGERASTRPGKNLTTSAASLPPQEATIESLTMVEDEDIRAEEKQDLEEGINRMRILDGRHASEEEERDENRERCPICLEPFGK